jgi:hypothetical protein
MGAYVTKETLVNNRMCGKIYLMFSFLMSVCTSVNFAPTSLIYIALA